MKCNHVSPISIALAVALAVVLSIVTGVSIYKRRFRLQYSCFRLRQRIGMIKTSETDAQSTTSIYKYDAFVSYSSLDRFWVHGVLMKTLEETHGFKLVIHHRDIAVGSNIMTALETLFDQSRQFILVLSDNFLQSDYCPMEMEEAYRLSRMRQRDIAVIVLGDLPDCSSNETARRVLDRYNYLQWNESLQTEDKEKINQQKLFWAKLVDYMYGGQASCMCCCPTGPRAVGYREVRHFTADDDVDDRPGDGQPCVNLAPDNNAPTDQDSDTDSEYRRVNAEIEVLRAQNS